jgi:hypothetical protein
MDKYALFFTHTNSDFVRLILPFYEISRPNFPLYYLFYMAFLEIYKWVKILMILLLL